MASPHPIESLEEFRRWFRDRGTFEDVVIRGVDLSRQNLVGTVFTAVFFEDARLDEADLSRAMLTRVVFAGGSMRGAKLDGAQMMSVVLLPQHERPFDASGIRMTGGFV